MESLSKVQLFFLTFCTILIITTTHAQTLQTYLVQLHPHGITSSTFTSKIKWHLSFLQQTISSYDDPSSRLLYSYRSAMDGFAARLTESELEYLQKLPDVISIWPDRQVQIQTTYSYKFLGLNPARESG
ncbi:putative tripeptidyl-peptidase II [Lupinus albus]|uniref:Putative tripeptidyl-peptidase II n=1 Tax=Lupinus albus TaxID=3870 RepID=A0A6A4NTI7_LUPAL|nr:putative tripeptidyl-peptidase II [Lupinus albus]